MEETKEHTHKHTEERKESEEHKEAKEDSKRESKEEAPEKQTVSEKPKEEPKEEKPREIKVEKQRKSILKTVLDFYDSQYKLLLVIPFFLLAISLVSIGLQYASTGDIIYRDVSLKGGVTLTITTNDVNINDAEDQLKTKFTENDIDVRSLTKFGTQVGIIITADIQGDQEDKLDNLIEETEKIIGMELTRENHTIEIVGSSLGASFFREVSIALLIAFIFMGLVVFLYFRNFVPSIAVILAAFSDIVVTLAIVNLMNIKLSTAGIAAFLMLIGYSVDTDILLSTRVLKRKEGTIFERILGAMKTGLTMTMTTLAALSVALLFTQSEVIRQIMIILLIGLFVDLINTWIQNVGILKLYLERKQKVK